MSTERRLANAAAHVLLVGFPMLRLVVTLCAAAAITALVGCGSSPDTSGNGAQTNGGSVTPGDDNGDNGDNSDGPIVAVDDSSPVTNLPTGLVVNAALDTTGDLNLRKGPGTTYAILLVIPDGSKVTLLNATPTNGFLNISFNGTDGWSSADYLEPLTTSGGTSGSTVDVNGAPSPDNAIARAQLSVGFSYYWGGGSWTDAAVSASTAGSCTGDCPSCTHKGSYGADCSGMVAKAWQFGAESLTTDSHPYSTVSFNSASSNWSTISRSDLKAGDAMTYNSDGDGHIVLYEKGDGWGTPTVYECRGCAYGCVHDARSFSSIYKGIRRTGF